MPQQIDEIEEIDETLEVSKDKIRNIQNRRLSGGDPIQFELTEVIKAGGHKGGDNDLPEYGRDRDEDEERESYIITVKNKKKREIVTMLEDDLHTIIEGDEVDEEEIRKYIVMVDKRGFQGLPEEL